MSLDIAAGTGDLALALSRRREIEHSVGLDLLPSMVALSTHKARRAGLSARTTMIVGDALALPFPDGQFACATAGFSLRNMPNLESALAEMVRVVRPGGRVATLELTPLTPGWKSRLFRLYFHGLVPLMGRLISGSRSDYAYLPKSVDYFLDADQLASLFGSLGLVDVGFRKLGMGTVAVHWGTRP